jgi:predicted ester cyclase
MYPRDDLKNLYRRFLLEAWEGDPDAVAPEVVSPDFVIYRNGKPGETRGPAALVELVSKGRAPFTDVAVSIEQGPLADGDLVAARWTFAGRYAGGIPGVSASEGTEVAFSGIDLLRVADGRFVEYWVSSDAEHLMAQLGPG